MWYESKLSTHYTLFLFDVLKKANFSKYFKWEQSAISPAQMFMSTLNTQPLNTSLRERTVDIYSLETNHSIVKQTNCLFWAAESGASRKTFQASYATTLEVQNISKILKEEKCDV